VTRLRDALTEMSNAFARYLVADWRRAGDEGYRGSLDEFLAGAEDVPGPVIELARAKREDA
jgi:hypothetical protein